ncbi:MAG: flagellar basal body rod C-terminal domain-containing protein [Nitrospiraceae bacterium]
MRPPRDSTVSAGSPSCGGVGGVADEELVNLLKYQRAFQAAFLLITTSDERCKPFLSIKQ